MFMLTLLNHVKTYSLLFLIADTKRYLNCLTALRFFKKKLFDRSNVVTAGTEELIWC